jgi:putative transposase
MDEVLLRLDAGQRLMGHYRTIQPSDEHEGLFLKAFRYRLYPTKRQVNTLEWTLRRCRELYNAALEERRSAYRKCRVSVGRFEQMRALPQIKAVRPEYNDVHSQVLQDVIKRLDKAFQGFFARVKARQKPGFPRFLGAHRYDSFCYPQYRANVADGASHVYLPKIGNVRIRLSRPLEGKIKTATIKRDVDQWYIIFACQVAPGALPRSGSGIGIDLGLEHFLTTSAGEFVDNPRHLRTAQKRLRRAQRSLARKKRGGRNRAKQRLRLAKLHRKVRRQRLDFHHPSWVGQTHWALT